MRWLALVVLVVSSGARAAPCAGEAIARAAKADWGISNALAMSCRPIRGKRGVRLVEARAGTDGNPGWLGIVDREDTILWSRLTYPGAAGQTITVSIIDLDGDGADEIVAHEIIEGRRGSGSATLRVFAIHADGIDEAGSLALGEDGGRDTGANGCSSTWAIVGGRGNRPRVQITATRLADAHLEPAPDSCPLDGVHRYRWTGEAFALAD